MGNIGDFPLAVSPDGRSAAFARSVSVGVEIRTISAQSGVETLLATLPGRAAGWVSDWSEDGLIYATVFTQTALPGAVNLRLSSTGAARLDTIPLPAGQGRFAFMMKRIPGSDLVLYSEGAPTAASNLRGRILVLRQRTRDTLFIADGITASWSPTGHVLVGREGGFIDAVPFDPEAFRITGPPREVLAGVLGTGAYVVFTGSSDGSLAYVSGAATGSSSATFALRWRGLDGTSERVPIPATDHNDAAVSPDGARIAYVRSGRIWIYEGLSGRDAPLSDDTLGTNEHDPLWSPDGRHLVFSSGRGGTFLNELYMHSADGGAVARVGGTTGFDAPLQWLNDSTILFVARMRERDGSGEQTDIYTVVLGRPGSEKAVLESPFNEHTAGVDPSGRWLSYLIEQDGANALYVRRYPSFANPVRIASGDDVGDRVRGRAGWSADGQSVFYVSAKDSLVRVTLDLSGEAARVVSRVGVLALGSSNDEITDRHPTNGRLLQWVVAEPERETGPSTLIMIVNFDQVIRRIMGQVR